MSLSCEQQEKMYLLYMNCNFKLSKYLIYALYLTRIWDQFDFIFLAITCLLLKTNQRNVTFPNHQLLFLSMRSFRNTSRAFTTIGEVSRQFFHFQIIIIYARWRRFSAWIHLNTSILKSVYIVGVGVVGSRGGEVKLIMLFITEAKREPGRTKREP